MINPLLGLTPSGLFMGLNSTLIYTSELILCSVLNPDEQRALEQVKKFLKYVDGRYQMALPWKESVPDLPDNYDMALRRLCNTEKHLLKNPEIAAAYSENITQYLEKGYIRKINPSEEKPARRWYLPHFPVVRLDRART